MSTIATRTWLFIVRSKPLINFHLGISQFLLMFLWLIWSHFTRFRHSISTDNLLHSMSVVLVSCPQDSSLIHRDISWPSSVLVQDAVSWDWYRKDLSEHDAFTMETWLLFLFQWSHSSSGFLSGLEHEHEHGYEILKEKVSITNIGMSDFAKLQLRNRF